VERHLKDRRFAFSRPTLQYSLKSSAKQDRTEKQECNIELRTRPDRSNHNFSALNMAKQTRQEWQEKKQREYKTEKGEGETG
jgi:hypothetical protein